MYKMFKLHTNKIARKKVDINGDSAEKALYRRQASKEILFNSYKYIFFFFAILVSPVLDGFK